MNRIRAFLVKVIDDILMVAGCGCILYGLSLWNVAVMWVCAGIMLIGWGVLIGKMKAKVSDAA
jgi:hypothetical protein